MPAQRILLPQWGGHELEIAAYEGEIDWGRDVTRALSLLSIYPSSPVNFVLGQISEPFVHRRKPVPLGNALVIGRILIHDIWSAWIGISCQLIKDNFFYEPAELFVPADWSGFAMANYLVGTRSSPKPLGQWFSFEVSVNHLLESLGWEVPGALVSRIGLVGDIQAGGRCAFRIGRLRIFV